MKSYSPEELKRLIKEGDIKAIENKYLKIILELSDMVDFIGRYKIIPNEKIGKVIKKGCWIRREIPTNGVILSTYNDEKHFISLLYSNSGTLELIGCNNDAYGIYFRDGVFSSKYVIEKITV